MISTRQISEFFRAFQKVEEPTLKYEKQLFQMTNDTFKAAIFSTSWFLYVTAVLLISCCLYFFCFEQKKWRANNRRIREIQQILERVPPRRRPGAVAREREIFRKVMATAYSYINPNSGRRQFVLRQTRSGTIYGNYLADES